jgi:GNAT superfamily N-acetyltransferase
VSAQIPAEELRIVRAESRHLAALPEIERAAASLFPKEDLSPEAWDDCTEPEAFADAAEEGRVWVALVDSATPVGFALVESIDGLPHLQEIDVHPDYARRGIGRLLVEKVLDTARRGGHAAVTLTTFRHLAWNAPFYQSCGFRELGDAELGAGLRRTLADEAATGLDPAKRVAMRCELD